MCWDGIYMASLSTPSSARRSASRPFDDVAHQITSSKAHARRQDRLLYHRLDESKQQRWAIARLAAPAFLGRAVAGTSWRLWTCWIICRKTSQASRHPGDFERVIAALESPDQSPVCGTRCSIRATAKALPRASGSCMFVYSYRKASGKGIFPNRAWRWRAKGYQGIWTI